MVLRPDAITLTEPVEAWELFDALTRSSISLSTVRQLESTMLRCAERYPVESPMTLGPMINRQLTRIADALKGPQPVAVRQRLVRLLGYLSGLAANIWVDRDELAMANGYFDVAAQASEEAGDGDLAAWIAANRAIAYHFDGELALSRSHLDEAAHQARAHSNRRRRAWVFALQARACAAVGDGDRTMSLLDESQATLAQTDDPIGGTDFFDEARLEGFRGSALLLLGEYGAAEEALVAAAEQRADSEVKGRALLALDLARCRLLQGEHDEAVQLALDSLELASGSLIQPITTRVTEVAAALQAAGAGRRVRPVLDRLVELDPKALERPS